MPRALCPLRCALSDHPFQHWFRLHAIGITQPTQQRRSSNVSHCYRSMSGSGTDSARGQHRGMSVSRLFAIHIRKHAAIPIVWRRTGPSKTPAQLAAFRMAGRFQVDSFGYYGVVRGLQPGSNLALCRIIILEGQMSESKINISLIEIPAIETAIR